MTESNFLSGKVLKHSLPIVQLPSDPDVPLLKRLLLPQGELAQFYDGEDPIRYLACIELRAGAVRGNHYHKIKAEWIYLVQGEVTLVVESVESGARERLPLKAGDLAFVSPGIAHALRTLQAGVAIEFSQARFDAADIHPYPIKDS
jgi:mannose-6-phosphate isomerase-like protein (cupin superfamily)